MEADPRIRTTALLTSGARGDIAASEALFALMAHELRDLAARHMARERRNHTLQPTALVHEAYMRLIRGDRVHLQGKRHFRALCARAMKQVLVDHARSHNSQKHNEGVPPITLVGDPQAPERGVRLDNLLEALEQLASRDARRARVVEMRFFGGMNDEEIGAELGVTSRTVRNDWRFARAWLRSRLEEDGR